MHHYDNENRVCTGFFGFEHLWSYFFGLSIQIVWFSGLVYVAALDESFFWNNLDNFQSASIGFQTLFLVVIYFWVS